VTETKAAVSGTGEWLRANMTRSRPTRTQKRPGGMKPLGRMKIHIQLCDIYFHIHNQTVPAAGQDFF